MALRAIPRRVSAGLQPASPDASPPINNGHEMTAAFSGLGLHLGNLSRLSDAKTRSISPENFTGEKGKGGMATEGTGASPARAPRPGLEGLALDRRSRPARPPSLADIAGPGAIQHIWLTLRRRRWRNLILRIYWDDQEQPVGRMPARRLLRHAAGSSYAQVNSLAVCVNPGRAFNCYWEMPFRKRARITLDEPRPDEPMIALLPDQLHADRRARRRGLLPRPVPPHQPAALQERLRRSSTACSGQGHYVGTYMAWGVNNTGWWGEGEIKFFIDGDGEFPTICGTGTEDYFCGAYNFDVGIVDPNVPHAYTRVHHALRRACRRCIRPDGTYRSQQRFGMYRWHITDPIRFEHGPARHDPGARLADRTRSAATCRCRTTSPRSPSGTRRCRTRRFPALPDRDFLEVI